MEKVHAYVGGPAVSRLAFGCAPVMGRVDRRRSLRAMAMAFDYGITHFDIARSYGFGDAEVVLGEFSAKRMSRITITSKFGVVPPELNLWQRAARPLLRMVQDQTKFLKKTVKKNSAKLLSERCYDLVYARSCLETSLRCLRRDHIDFYLMHEPDTGQLSGLDELHAFLDNCVVEGKIGRWGIAFPESISDEIQVGEWGSIVQYGSLINGNIKPPQFANAEFKFITRPLGGSAALQSTLLMKLAEYLEISIVDAAFAIAGYQAGSHGSVVAGMFDGAHIKGNVSSMTAYLHDKEAIDLKLTKFFSGISNV